MNRFLVAATRVAVLGGILALGVALTGTGLAGAAKRRAPGVSAGPPVWPGSRAVMVLPLKLGADWNADPAVGEALLQPAEERLLTALSATGKLEPMTADRFNPILLRARRENALVASRGDTPRLQDSDFTKLIAMPSVENARAVLAGLTFDQTPMIADCTLEELRTGGTAQQPQIAVRVTGYLYRGSDTDPFRKLSVTGDPVRTGRTNYERTILACDDAFRRLAAAFVAPLDDIQLNLPSAVPTKGGQAGIKQPTGSADASTTGTTLSGSGGANGSAGGSASSGTTRVPVPTKPLPEVKGRGDLPMFPQGRQPLAPGSDNPDRFQGAAPAVNPPAANPPAANPPVANPPADNNAPAPAPVPAAPAMEAPAEDAPAAAVPAPAEEAPAADAA